MSRPEVLRIFVYDISDDRRRNRVAETLEEVAVRVQFSVFEARLTRAATNAVIARLRPNLTADDSLRVYTVPADAVRHCTVIGGPPLPEDQDYWLF